MLSSVFAFLPFHTTRMRLLFGAACLLIAACALAGTDEKKAAPVRTHEAASIPQVVVTAKRMSNEQKKRYDQEKMRAHDAAEYGSK